MPLTARSPSRQLVDLVGALGGTWHGLVAMCRCPAHADRSPSLSLRQGDIGILVTCFAGCEREDVLRELARVPISGLFPMPPTMPPPSTANVERLWEQAGSADAPLARTYLGGRGFVRTPPDIRYHPRCPHGPRPHTVLKPAILVAVRERRKLVAVQRIFLDPDTGGYTAKATLGRPGRGAWQGRAAGAVLALAEGFETAEAFAILHGVPCWATLGARRLDQVDIPTGVNELLIAEDNDAEGRRAALRACDHYARAGLVVRRDPPPRHCKDWAQALELQMKRGGGVG